MNNQGYEKNYEMGAIDVPSNLTFHSLYQQHKHPSQNNMIDKIDTQSVNSGNVFHAVDTTSMSSVSVSQTPGTTALSSRTISPNAAVQIEAANAEEQGNNRAKKYRRKITKTKQDSSFFNLTALEQEPNGNVTSGSHPATGQKGDSKTKQGEDIHFISVNDFLDRVKSDRVNGLTSAEAEMRLLRDGQNTLHKRRRIPVPILFLRELVTGFAPIYWLIIILLIISYEPLGGANPSIYNVALAIITMVILFLSSLLSFIVKFRANKLMEHFLKMLPHLTHTLRDGQWIDIETTKLVVGDVVRLRLGDQFPADVRALETTCAKMDKSPLTGESKPVTLVNEPTDEDFNETRNIGFMGTNLVEGEATCVVFAVSDNTSIGRIATLSDRTKRKMTNLEKDFYYFTFLELCFAFGWIIIVVLYWVLYLRVAYPGVLNVAGLIGVCAAVPIAFLPEGLAISYVCSLMIVAQQMRGANVAVKNLSIIETLGSISVICSDKTGTITQNKMTLSHVWTVGADEEENSVAAASDSNTEDLTEESGKDIAQTVKRRLSTVSKAGGKPLLALQGSKANAGAIDLIEQSNNEASPLLKFMMSVNVLCNSATIDHVSKHITGSSTESALLAGALNYINVDEVRADFPMTSQVPFDSSRKYQITVHDCNPKLIGKIINPNQQTSPNLFQQIQSSKTLVVAKGGSEIIMDMCRYCLYNEEIVPFTEERRSSSLNAMQTLAANGERVLGLAFSLEPDSTDLLNVENAEIETKVKSDLCFLALTSLLDPPKVGVKEAVRDCHTAFIKVAMVTGDHPSTAKAIARKVEIFESDTKPMTLEDIREHLKEAENQGIAPTVNRESQILIVGKEISSISKPEWEFIMKHWEFVFARTTPENKLEIVKHFQTKGNQVAVTGDGVNDAAALKRADVGIAMGIMGSEISKEAANVILADDNFASIVNAIRLGRLVFNNLRKVVCYLITEGCFCELMAMLINTFLGIPMPDSAFLMITICVTSDIIGAVSMVYEPAESEIMKRKPRNSRKHHLVDMKLLTYAYFFIGIISIFGSMLNYFVAMWMVGGCTFSELLFAYDFGVWPTLNVTNITIPNMLSNITNLTTTTILPMTTSVNPNLTYCGLDPDQQNYVLQYGQTAFYASSIIFNAWNFIAVNRMRRMSVFQQKFRKEHVYVIIAQLMILFIVCYLPFINNVMLTAPINYYSFLIPLAYGIILPILDELRKLLLRKYPKNIISRWAW